MAESRHDDLADALARMAGGDVAPSEHEPAAPITPPLAPVRKAAPQRAAAPVLGQTVSKPAMGTNPTVPGQQRPVARPATATGSTPPALPRARPATPPATPVTPVVSPPSASARPAVPTRPQRPTAPTISVPVEQPVDDADQSTALTGDADGQIIDDDDAVIVPAPDASVFTNKPKGAAAARAKVQLRKKINYRQTLIPILLTTGAIMCGFGSLKFLVGEDSTLSAMPAYIPVVLFAVGAGLWALAAMNILSVSKLLRKAEAP